MSQKKSQKYFITGATGFIGQHLCKLLSEQGHHIVALVRNPDKLKNLPQDNIQVIKGDLSSFKSKDFKIPSCDQVIHLAGTVTANKQSDYLKNNFQSVVDLYDCLLRQDWQPKRFHFSSSLAATGPSKEEEPLTEAHPPKPVDAYGQAKLDAENFLLNQNEFPVTVFRPCSVIGPMDTNVFNLYKMGKSGFGFVPWGKSQKISFIAVSDLVSAIEKLTQDDTNKHRTYFISHENVTDVNALWHYVSQTLGKKIRIIPVPKPILYVAMQANTAYANLFGKQNMFDKKYYDQIKAPAWTCSSQNLQKDFGWNAKQDLAEVFAETAASYRQAGWI